MGFFDLSIPYTDRSTRAKLALKALELGFTGIAYNRTIKGLMSDRDRCSIPLLTLPSLLALSSSAAFHRHLLSLPRASPFRQYTRLTVSADSPAHTQALNSANPVLKTYDIVAVKPMNQAAFDQACQKLEVDIIAIDFSEKLPFRLKQPLIKAAIQRKVYFEITYAGFVADAQTRRQIITNAKLLVDWTRGRNIIISSAAPTVNEFRGPLDVANLMSLLGLSVERAKAAISRNCRALLLNAMRKKHYHKEAIKVEMLPSGQESDGNKPGSSDLFDWDPISSGEGDLVLEDLAKAFSNSSSKLTKMVNQAKKFASVIDNTPSLGFQINDLKSGSNAVVSQQLATRNIIHSAPEENAQSVVANRVQGQSILYDRMLEQQRFKSMNHPKLILPCDTTKAVSNVIEIEDHTVTTTTGKHDVKSLVSGISNDDDIMEIEVPTTTGAEPMNSAKSKGFTKEIHDVQSLKSVTAEASNNAMEIEAPMTTVVETKNVDGIDVVITEIDDVQSQKSTSNSELNHVPPHFNVTSHALDIGSVGSNTDCDVPVPTNYQDNDIPGPRNEEADRCKSGEIQSDVIDAYLSGQAKISLPLGSAAVDRSTPETDEFMKSGDDAVALANQVPVLDSNADMRIAVNYSVVNHGTEEVTMGEQEHGENDELNYPAVVQSGSEKFKAKRKRSHQVTLLPLKRLLHARSFKRTRTSKRRNMMQ